MSIIEVLWLKAEGQVAAKNREMDLREREIALAEHKMLLEECKYEDSRYSQYRHSNFTKLVAGTLTKEITLSYSVCIFIIYWHLHQRSKSFEQVTIHRYFKTKHNL